MIDNLLERNANDKAIEIVLKDHPDIRLLWERRHLIKGPIAINDVNPILHILTESIVESQIMECNPAEVRSALDRLKEKGVSHHAFRTTIASILLNCLFDTLKENKPFDVKKYSKQLEMLGANVVIAGKVGRNEPCPCGSGKKYKRCCIDKHESNLSLKRSLGSQAIADEKLILGSGHYATFGYLKNARHDDTVILLENRYHISKYLEKNGDLEGAYLVLKENIDSAMSLGNKGLIKNAYQDLLHFCFNNADEYAEEGIEAIESLLPLSSGEDEIGYLRCDKADLLAKMNKIDEAEKEFGAIFKEMPEWHFARYRYALYLEDTGKKNDAIDVLNQLISIKNKLDEDTYNAVVEVLENTGILNSL